MGNSGSNNRSGHQQFPDSRNFILPVSFGYGFNFIKRPTAMAQIQLGKFFLWVFGVPTFWWTYYENNLKPNTWQANILFAIAVTFLVVRTIVYAVKSYQSIIKENQELKSKDIDLKKKEFETEEFFHDKNEE